MEILAWVFRRKILSLDCRLEEHLKRKTTVHKIAYLEFLNYLLKIQLHGKPQLIQVVDYSTINNKQVEEVFLHKANNNKNSLHLH